MKMEFISNAQRTANKVQAEAKERKRQRNVFPTNEIPHLWAHQVQNSARSAQGNFYFIGDTIYSYGSHFPIARRVTNSAGKAAVLMTTRTYSVTTAGHVHMVRMAIPDSTPIFYVERITPDASIALQHAGFIAIVQVLIDALDRPKGVSADRKLKTFAELMAAIDDSNKFAEFFKLRGRMKLPARFHTPEFMAELQRGREIKQRRQIAASEAATTRRANQRAKWARIAADSAARRTKDRRMDTRCDGRYMPV